MKQQNIQAVCHAEKFQNAEQLWFWFLYSRSIQPQLRNVHGRATRRICEWLDVETLITKLYLSGDLTDEQIDVMKRFGDRRRAPHQHIWSENRDSAIWQNAMEILQMAAQSRGWIA